jgi:cytochrome c553
LLTGGQTFAGDAAAGKAKSESCVACHGEDGKEGDKPIVGLVEADFIKNMKDYQSGAKQNKKMLKATKGLTDDDIANLAAYYSGMK